MRYPQLAILVLTTFTSGQQKLYPENTSFGNTRLFYWGTTPQQNHSGGHCVINYGQPTWNAGFEKALSAEPFRRWRFGRNHWTTLDCDVELVFDKILTVPPGHYFVAFDRNKKGVYGLVLLDPERLRARNLDSYQAHLTKGGTFVPLQHSTSKTLQPQLKMQLQVVGKADATLDIAFGPHRLTTSLRMRGVEPQAALPDPGVQVPRQVQWILQHAKALEIFALDPSRRDPGVKGFHGFAVLGRATVDKAADKRKLLGLVYGGMADIDARPARCWAPRHGFRAALGHLRVELVICYQCSQVRIHTTGSPPLNGTTGSRTKAALNVMFNTFDLQVAK